jgi:hypothetical protein
MNLWLQTVSKHKTWPPERFSVLHHILENFKNHFQLNILPADYSLIQQYMPHLRYDLGQREFPYLHELAIILFKVVIMRIYLGRKPCDDDQIFFLAYQTGDDHANIPPDDPFAEAKLGSLHRTQTLPERVMDSCARSSHKLRREIEEMEFPPKLLLASALGDKGQAYPFFHTAANGLYSPKKFVPRFRDPRFLKPLKYTPSPEQVPTPRPRPKPIQKSLPKGPGPIQPSQPRLIMHNYINHEDTSSLFVPGPSELKSVSQKAKRQQSREEDDPNPQVVPRRSSRLNK